LAPFYNSRLHGWTFSSSCACVHTFRLPHSLHNKQPFNRFLGNSNTHLSLGFGVPLLHRLILLVFPMLILRIVELTERAFLVHAIFLDLLWFTGLLENNLQLLHPLEAEYVAAASRCSQILWIVHTMRDFRVIFERVPLMCDNTSAISVAKNPIFHKRMRHLERRDHVEREISR
jgi:hypothetical protein